MWRPYHSCPPTDTESTISASGTIARSCRRSPGLATFRCSEIHVYVETKTSATDCTSTPLTTARPLFPPDHAGNSGPGGAVCLQLMKPTVLQIPSLMHDLPDHFGADFTPLGRHHPHRLAFDSPLSASLACRPSLLKAQESQRNLQGFPQGIVLLFDPQHHVHVKVLLHKGDPGSNACDATVNPISLRLHTASVFRFSFPVNTAPPRSDAKSPLDRHPHDCLRAPPRYRTQFHRRPHRPWRRVARTHVAHLARRHVLDLLHLTTMHKE